MLYVVYMKLAVVHRRRCTNMHGVRVVYMYEEGELNLGALGSIFENHYARVARLSSSIYRWLNRLQCDAEAYKV